MKNKKLKKCATHSASVLTRETPRHRATPVNERALSVPRVCSLPPVDSLPRGRVSRGRLGCPFPYTTRVCQVSDVAPTANYGSGVMAAAQLSFCCRCAVVSEVPAQALLAAHRSTLPSNTPDARCRGLAGNVVQRPLNVLVERQLLRNSVLCVARLAARAVGGVRSGP